MKPKIGIILQLWAREQCPVAYGIYFPDDTFVPFLKRHASGGRVPISADSYKIDKCAHLYPTCLFRSGIQIWGGETSWEGVGFLAVCNARGDLQWLLHCESSEPFVSAFVDDGHVVAVSGANPSRFEWKLSLTKPWE